MSTELMVWEQPDKLDEIKKRFCDGMPEPDVQLFIKMGLALNLNPYLKEIWAIPYNSKKGKVWQIFVGRDGYRKNAQKHPLYSSHYARAIYTNDNFQFSEGKIIHTFDIKNRGNLYGAYALVYRHGATEPIYVDVLFSEYAKPTEWGSSTWDKMPETMIKKVAEAQCLRMGFQEMFAGTYDESEEWKEELTSAKKTINTQGAKILSLEEKLGLSDAEIINEPTKLDSMLALIQRAACLDELEKTATYAKNLDEADKQQAREAYKIRETKLKEMGI